MRRYSEAVKADVRRRMSPPHRQSVAQISAELGIHVVTLYSLRKAWLLEGQVVHALRRIQRVGGRPTNSRWSWKPPALTRRNLVPTAARGFVPRAGGPLATGRPGCECTATVDHGRAEGPGEASPGRSAGNQRTPAGAAP
jgi:hypothetical protein